MSVWPPHLDEGGQTLTFMRPINDAYSFVGRVGVAYVGARDSLTVQRSRLPAYTLVNLRAGVQAENWQTLLFVNNLTNKRVVLSNTTSLVANLPTLDRVSTNRPRAVGIDFSRDF